MREYTTERDVTIGVVPIPLFLEEIRKAHPEPERPTYTEHTAGGAEREIAITDREAEVWAEHDPDTWAEHAEAWAEFEKKRNAHQEKLNDVIWRAVMLRSLVVELPDNHEWVKEQEELGIKVPSGKKDRRIHYIRTEVIGGMRDVLRLTAIANGGDLSEEALSLAEASFRHSLAKSILEGFARQNRAVDVGHESSAGEDREGVGAET